MSKTTKFTARFSPEEQALLVHVAAHMQRSKSDTVRILIQEKALELGLYPVRHAQSRPWRDTHDQ
jgi:hypothetical protein